MFTGIVTRIGRRLGYVVRKVPRNYSFEERYVLYPQKNHFGETDKAQYASIQEKANKSKIQRTFAKEDTIKFISEYITKRIPNVSRGICHGTRQGLEQTWFRKILGADVIGTEISETAEDFDHTIKWDFHDVKEEWLSRFDFIYSNSLDHSYNPQQCLDAWMSCLRPGGLCLLEYSAHSGIWTANERDPFGIELDDIPWVILRWGQGRYSVREILRIPKGEKERKDHALVVIYRYPEVE